MPKKATEAIDWLLYERACVDEGFKHICGVDEAGRGPLAGPVFAAAVILPPDTIIDGVNDSKKLTEKKREQLFDIIREAALSYSIAAATEREIDEINILQATFLAMRRAVEGLRAVGDDPQIVPRVDEGVDPYEPHIVLVDGNHMPPGLPCECRTIVKGDGLSMSIACASILAKVARDRYMRVLDEKYPAYGFAAHKGYGTAAHYAALRQHGVSPVHRVTFLKNL